MSVYILKRFLNEPKYNWFHIKKYLFEQFLISDLIFSC